MEFAFNRPRSGLITPTETTNGRSFFLAILYIALGGVAGTLSRYGLEGWIQTRTTSGFPLGTLTVNLTGSLLLGFILRIATGATLISPDWRAGLTIGFCGAFTTMSTFSYESVTLLSDGDYLHAGLYMSATILGCVVAVILGTALANKLL
jgi:fluoride exporter